MILSPRNCLVEALSFHQMNSFLRQFTSQVGTKMSCPLEARRGGVGTAVDSCYLLQKDICDSAVQLMTENFMHDHVFTE